MRYARGSSDIYSFNRARRAQALNFADRYRFPIWAPRPQPEPSGSNQEKVQPCKFTKPS